MEDDAKKDGAKIDDVKKDEWPIEKTSERLVRLEVQVVNIAAGVVEIKSDVKDLRTRMEEGFQAVRKEMHEGDQALRKEMNDGFQSIRKELSDAKIWALLIGAAILSVLARGFHWI
jgi:hypothetical protein